ncbi:MAG: RNA polymerase sporulation sigma factor SigH [Clostridia bacterium]|nr:RNA polymerase sporulation sigma factor SigH [Clostridia bacterium]MBR3461029.1 RNA polymerase sporulation sigma factor SigH [Clostridia bacterium]MBR5714549.1 RNA polymerase sporulation sigma factor SigH [Clostridia bacterium]MBR5718399.1 RNA polymerase sporulation sigma factor SigH [Clostridia bacterium]
MTDFTTPEYGAMSDEELVALAKNHDSTASDELYHRYKNTVRGKARPYFLVGADRDDLVQEGMIGLFKAIRDYDSVKNDSFHPFAEMCIVRQILTAIKQATRNKHLPLNKYESLYKSVYDDDSEKQLVDVIGFSSALNPEELYIKQEFSIALENALNNSLTEYERNVLDRFLDGKSYSDIAAELDHSVKSVDNALQRIRKKLEKLFPSSH